jgi:hypothetical protein
MIKPTVHLNGSSAEQLFEQICQALGALRVAQAALEQMGPNARDYYPQGPAAYTTARAEHQARHEHLRCVQEELEAIAEHVANERDARRRR